MDKTIFDIKGADKSSIGVLADSCSKIEGADFSSTKQADGKFRVTCVLKSAPAVPTTPSGVQITVGDTELDALSRVAASEVGHFGKYGDAMLRGGLAAVVDTIFNRVAHDRYPDSIEQVVDKPFQFSAINAVGSWAGLPKASAAIAQIVAQHISARVSGAASEIKGATHFLNPHLADTTALLSWGNHVVQNAIAVYGNDAMKDVHFHGFPPLASLPKPYSVVFDGQSTHFSSTGSAPGGGIARADLRDGIERRCREELAFFNGGSAKEGDDPQFKRIGEYWSVVGLSHHGRTKITDASTGKTYNPPWSAVFVSCVVRTAGAGDEFPAHQAHCHYFQHFVDPPSDALYEAFPQRAVVPEVGDILHYGRTSAKRFDFAEARARYPTDSFYASHSDIVVDVNLAGNKLTTVGGNVSNSVKEKTVRLDSNGLLLDRQEGGTAFPWIGILKFRG